MKSLLYKEFKLTIHPLFLLISLLGAMVLIPDWPYFIAMMYFFICVPSLFAVCKEQNDMGFMVMMPISRKNIVKSRLISVILLELLQIIVTMIFAIINIKLYGNGKFLDPNASFFGFTFVMYAIYNGIFFSAFYKTGSKIILPVILSTAASILFAGVVECIVMLFPVAADLLDGSEIKIYHILVLFIGIAAFTVINYLTYKSSVKRFEELDLC